MTYVGKYDTATDDTITWRVCFACWITKATNSHSEYVIRQALTSFALRMKGWLEDKVWCLYGSTRWFKYDRDDLCVNKSQFVPVIFELTCKIKTRFS
jgi:hypothetical protein